MEGTDLAGETGAATIDLTEQEDGKTWKLEGAQYLLPPSESSTTITVNIVKSEGTSSYTYNTGEQLGEGQITPTLTLSSTNILRPVTLIRIAEE